MFFSEFTRTKWHCAIAISQFGFCVIAKWVFATLYVAISPQLHAVYSRWTTVVVIELL